MEGVKITDTGDALLISGPSKAMVDRALQELISQGAKATSAATPLGTKWLASCTKPSPATVDVAQAVARASLSSVTISDAGSHLIVSGEDRESVLAALSELSKSGAEPTAEIVNVGRKWIGRCENLGFGLREVKVEQYGLSYVISGKSREAVQTKLQEFIAKGGSVLVEMQQVADEWVVTCDTGGGHDEAHKW